jgi:hypothetical protein
MKFSAPIHAENTYADIGEDRFESVDRSVVGKLILTGFAEIYSARKCDKLFGSGEHCFS